MHETPHIGSSLGGAASKGGACPMCGNTDPFDRSPSHHNLFFAVTAQAFQQWPEAHRFQPTSAEHLRGWLCIEAGHSLSMSIDGPKNITVRTVATVRNLLREMGSSETALIAMRMYETKTGIRIVVPKSMSSKGSKRVGKREFQEVSQKVFEIIEATLGVTIEQLKNARAA